MLAVNSRRCNPASWPLLGPTDEMQRSVLHMRHSEAHCHTHKTTAVDTTIDQPTNKQLTHCSLPTTHTQQLTTQSYTKAQHCTQLANAVTPHDRTIATTTASTHTLTGSFSHTPTALLLPPMHERMNEVNEQKQHCKQAKHSCQLQHDQPLLSSNNHTTLTVLTSHNISHQH